MTQILTKEQQLTLKELKNRLTLSGFREDLEYHDDTYLIRFLRGTMKNKEDINGQFNIDLAEHRLEQNFIWRRNYEINNMKKPKGCEILEKINPSVVVVSKKGSFYKFDRWTYMASLVDESLLTESEWIQCVAYTVEKMIQSMKLESERQGYEITKYTHIIDCEGMNFRGLVARRKFLQFLNKIVAENYPEVLDQVYLINSPWYIFQVFEMVKPFIDKETLKKLHIHKGVPTAELSTLVSKELLLKQYGGENQTKLPKSTI